MNIRNDRRMLQILNILLLIMTITGWWLGDMKATFASAAPFTVFILVNLYLFLTKEPKKTLPQ